ncbi:MAG: FAD binding domain-containing protein [Syntrophorhabdales bacterium]|jgi:xanthine dehydrogenase YagS FAD-binding subunit
MRTFAHFNPRTLNEAVAILQRYGTKARVIAGGTDILGKMKDRILPVYPEALVNIKTIADLDFIETTRGTARIGALARLEDIAANEMIKERYPALAEAARRTASPHLRAMGTIGGNICQDIRCWYYRNANNRFPCMRKGGGRCYAIEGDNRFHSIFGGSVEGGCYAVHPSDTAPALLVLGALAKTTKRTIPLDDFFGVDVRKTTVLDPDEIVTELRIPAPTKGMKSAFLKFALRKSIDFPIVNCAAAVTLSGDRVASAKICLNAVYVKPYRASAGEELIRGKSLSDEDIGAAADAAVSGAVPMTRNRYMIQVARTLVKRTLMACR